MAPLSPVLSRELLLLDRGLRTFMEEGGGKGKRRWRRRWGLGAAHLHPLQGGRRGRGRRHPRGLEL